MRTGQPPRGGIAAAATCLALVTVGAVACAVGASPSLFALAVLASIVLALGPHVGWTLSLPLALVGGFAVAILVLRLAPMLGTDLLWTAIVVFALVALAAIAAIAMAEGGALPAPGAQRVAAAALVVPVVVLVAATFAFASAGEPRVLWAMNNDAVWNTVSSRLIVTDGGLASGASPNPSPLANGLVALWYLPGRADLSVGLLQHDIARQTELLLLMIGLASAVCGLTAARSAGGRRRVPAAVIGALLPWTWLLTGWTVTLGFFNVVPVVALLACVWLIWCGADAEPAVAIPGLLGAAMVLLAAWAPMAAFPAVFAAVAAVLALRARRLTGGAYLAIGLGAALLGAYALLITLPDLRRSGHALAAEGGVPPIPPVSLGLAVAILFVVIVGAARARGRWRDVLGICLLVGVGFGVMGYLAAQRLGMPSLWGYYPVKFAWIVAIVVFVIGAGSALAWADLARSRWARTLAVSAAAVGVVIAVVAAVPLPAKTIQSALPPVGFFDRPGPALDARQHQVFELSDGERTIAARLSADPLDDAFSNLWLLQLFSVTSEEQIRSWAYTLDGRSASDICAAIATWAEEVRVVTTDSGLAAELADECGDLPYTVEVRTPAASVSAY